ncbi:MAG: hypothetical protein OIF48_20280 [Silicimonas sp.]|nr:hypothetical protein [Silicimonas sp.]
MVERLKTGLVRFLAKEDGGVTVDWVVMVGGILGMTFVVMGSISGGVEAFGSRAETELASRELGVN